MVTARRPVMEAALARVAERIPGVEIRRGTAVGGLLLGPEVVAGVPHVAGVVTPAGEELRADLVVDAGGRRSAFPSWLAAAGGPSIPEERADAGFVYYCRHFCSGDGSVPSPIGPAAPGLRLDLAPGAAGRSRDLGRRHHQQWPRRHHARHARDPEIWDRVVRSYPLIAPWLEGEPITGVDVMAGIPDVRRSYWPDGVPLVTGAVAVGDAWAATNPSLGRGASIGLRHAVGLRHVLRCAPGADPFDLARCWMEVTEGTAGHLVEETLTFDRHRLAEIDAQLDGRCYETDDPSWNLGQSMRAGAGRDPDLLRRHRPSAAFWREGWTPSPTLRCWPRPKPSRRTRPRSPGRPAWSCWTSSPRSERAAGRRSYSRSGPGRPFVGGGAGAMASETVTVLFNDLVGSTELLSRVGEARADELRRELFALLRRPRRSRGAERSRTSVMG